MVEWASKNDCHQHLYPQFESQLSPAFPGEFIRASPEHGLGSFQIITSALSLRACEVLCVPTKSRVSISYILLALPKAKTTDLKAIHCWNSSSQCRTPGLGSLMQGLNECLILGWGVEISEIVIIPALWLFFIALPGYADFDYISSLLVLPVLSWFFLYVFSCRSLLLVFGVLIKSCSVNICYFACPW